ncbi:hypothetical protein BDV06DRAFT_218391 [Aspergillus oleicola]
MNATRYITPLEEPTRFPIAKYLPCLAAIIANPPTLPIIRGCFVSQVCTIQQWTPGYHTQLVVEDKSRQRVTIGLTFDQDQRGTKLITSLESGFTVMILDAQMQTLVNGKQGIVVKDVKKIKVLPCNTQTLARLNKTILDANFSKSGTRVHVECYGCRK